MLIFYGLIELNEPTVKIAMHVLSCLTHSKLRCGHSSEHSCKLIREAVFPQLPVFSKLGYMIISLISSYCILPGYLMSVKTVVTLDTLVTAKDIP